MNDMRSKITEIVAQNKVKSKRQEAKCRSLGIVRIADRTNSQQTI